MAQLPDLRNIASASKQVATKSAMNPILWMSAISVPFAIVCSVFASPPLSYILIMLALIPIATTCWGFQYFAKQDPKRLQSEGHLEQMEVLGRLGSNKTGQEIVINPNEAAVQRQIAIGETI